MPYIDLKTTVKLNDDTKTKLKEELGKIISLVPGKSEAVTMIGLIDEYDLYKGGKKLTAGAYVEVKSFMEVPRSNKEEVTKKIFLLLKEVLSISKEHAYITFYDQKEWGYNGELL